jgi:hypothetical protein
LLRNIEMDKRKNPNFIKQFDSFSRFVSWVHKTVNGVSYITTVDQTKDILVPQNLFVVGSINNPSDIALKDNIKLIQNPDLLFEIEPKQYTFLTDFEKKLHYGIIAQDLEALFPNLVSTIVLDDTQVKTINYIELIPLLIYQIKELKKEIINIQSNTK